MPDPISPGSVPPEQGRLAKIPYDLHLPTPERVAARMWNPDDGRLFTPKVFGWGYDLNFYWLAHPVRYFTHRT
jgi:hypothetical protein